MYFLTAPELPSFVSKASVKNFYCVGLIATAMQCIFIERTADKEGALKAIKRRQQIIHQGFPKLLVFPEGTTTNGYGVMPFKKGGFIEKLPVQPVCIKYEEGGFSPCMEIVPIWAHVIMLACQVKNEMTVTRLPVVTAKAEWTAEEYAEHVRGLIAEQLKVPKVQFDIQEKEKLITKIFSEKPKEF
jgi:lysophosphatidylcholine acyltransferase/lyso-PAF acetyltransferase